MDLSRTGLRRDTRDKHSTHTISIYIYISLGVPVADPGHLDCPAQHVLVQHATKVLGVPLVGFAALDQVANNVVLGPQRPAHTPIGHGLNSQGLARVQESGPGRTKTVELRLGEEQATLLHGGEEVTQRPQTQCDQPFVVVLITVVGL